MVTVKADGRLSVRVGGEKLIRRECERVLWRERFLKGRREERGVADLGTRMWRGAWIYLLAMFSLMRCLSSVPNVVLLAPRLCVFLAPRRLCDWVLMCCPKRHPLFFFLEKKRDTCECVPPETPFFWSPRCFLLSVRCRRRAALGLLIKATCL